MTFLDRISIFINSIGADVKNLFLNKQDKLTSGNNIKTINGTSILGPGNITIAGGSVSHTEIVIDFGLITKKTNNKKFFVPDTNVLSFSKISVSVSGNATTDHSSDEIVLLQVSVFASNIQNGIGFDISAISPQKVYGKVKVNYLITN
jgi:hypothetical protein